MNNLRKCDLARACNVSDAYIKVNINRGKIHIGPDNLIDLTHPTNKAFINYQIASGKTFDINNIFIKNAKPKIEKVSKIDTVKTKPVEQKKEKNKSVEINKPENNIADFLNDGENLAVQKMQFEVNKLRLDCDLKELQKSKIEGSLVPVDAVQSVFLYSVETFHNTYLQEVQSLAQIMQSGVSFEVVLKDIHKVLTRLKEDAKANIIAGIEGVVNEYKEVRGRGEKK